MPPAYEVLLLNTAIPQIQAAQSGDTYLVPRDIAFSTVASFAAGAEATPSIVATGDANTGIWFPAADTVAVSTNGISRLRLDSSGNLGLGVTPSPWQANGKALEFSAGAIYSYLSGASGEFDYAYNAYFDGGWKYKASSSAASLYSIQPGIYKWFNAPSGTANSASVTSGASYTVVALGSSTLAQWQAFFNDSSNNPLTVTPTLGQVLTGNATGTLLGGGLVTQIISFTQAMTLNASGNLGIGETNPAQTLHVKTSTSATPITLGVLSNATGLPALSFNGAYASTTMAGIYGNGATASNLYYTVPASQSHFFAIADATKMTLDASGNLGVGETNPGARLHVDSGSTGNYAIFKSTNANGGYAAFYSSSTVQGDIGTAAQIVSGGAATDFGVNARGSRNLIFGTNNAERARITSGGYFKASDNGSYNNVAGTYHEFNQSANSIGLVVDSTNASLANEVLWLAASRNTTNNSFYAISYYNAGAAAYKFRVADSGDVTNTNGTYGTIPSERRFKQDIIDAPSQWDDIKNIRLRKFRLKSDVERDGDAALVQLGVIVDELEQVSPGLIDEHPIYEDREVTDDAGNVTKERVQVDTVKGWKTSIVHLKALKALQEAMARIEKLEAEVAALKGA